MPGRALQIVGLSIVVFIAQRMFNHAGQSGCYATQLLVAKGVFVERARNQSAICIASSL
jgi:hypothetical protein